MKFLCAAFSSFLSYSPMELAEVCSIKTRSAEKKKRCKFFKKNSSAPYAR